MENTTKRSATVGNIIKGLLAIQSSLHVGKDKMGQIGQQKYMYADLAAVWDACRDQLKEHGMVVMHDSETNASNDGIVVTATVHHTSGEWMSSSIMTKPRSMAPQDVGSALTYGRRYTLAALVGIVVDDDDDGKKASTPKPANDAAAELKRLKRELRNALQKYTGKDREDIREELTAAQNDGTFTLELISDVCKRTGITLPPAR